MQPLDRRRERPLGEHQAERTIWKTKANARSADRPTVLVTIFVAVLIPPSATAWLLTVAEAVEVAERDRESRGTEAYSSMP
ncbi:hypothetical protein JCM18549_26870 [Halolamina salina]